MNISRRGLVAGLGALIVGGGKAAAKAISLNMALSPSAGMAIGGYATESPPSVRYGTRAYWAGEVANVRKYLAKFLKDGADDYRRNVEVTRLDADLAVNRSLSLSAKIAIQRERMVARYVAREEKSFQERIADYMTQQMEAKE
jgi:hypothetical protein